MIPNDFPACTLPVQQTSPVFSWCIWYAPLASTTVLGLVYAISRYFKLLQSVSTTLNIICGPSGCVNKITMLAMNMDLDGFLTWATLQYRYPSCTHHPQDRSSASIQLVPTLPHYPGGTGMQPSPTLPQRWWRCWYADCAKMGGMGHKSNGNIWPLYESTSPVANCTVWRQTAGLAANCSPSGRLLIPAANRISYQKPSETHQKWTASQYNGMTPQRYSNIVIQQYNNIITLYCNIIIREY